MRRLRRNAVILMATLALFALAGAVLAAGDDDTVVNFGYDEDSKFFMWNVTSLDYEPWLEAIADDPASPEPDIDALLASCGLEAEEGADPVEYGYTFDGDNVSLFELNEDGEFDPEGEPFDTGQCGEFVGAVVSGPNGQVNHGMFMKTFNSLFEGKHRGCIVRHLAQSNLGKDEQKVKAGEETADELDVIEGSVIFDTVTTTCLHKKDRAEDEVESEAKGGPPQHVLDKFGGEHPKDKVKKEKKEGKGKPEGTPGGGRP